MVRWPALLLLAASCVSTAPKYSFSLPDLHTKLQNGMRVILLPDETTSLVEVDVRYEVGSREDPEGKAGLAHLVEHLMFEQRQAGPDKPSIGTVLRKSAVFINAFTNWDSTHYLSMAPAASVETLVALEAARLHTGCDTIDEATFQREREVVRNEIRTRMGSPEAEVSVRVLETLYPVGHAYHRIIGGNDTELVNITLADVCKFMQDYYTPERAVVLIAGKITKADGERIVAQYLAPLPARKPAARRAVAPISPVSRTVEIELPVEEPMVVAAWPLPPAYSHDGRLANYGIGDLAGFTAWFGATYEFTTDVGIGVLGGPEAPILALYVSVLDESKIDDAKSALRKGAAHAQRKVYLDKDATQEFRARAKGNRVAAMEGLGTRTYLFAEWAQFIPDDGYFHGELDRVNQIKDSDLSSVLKRVMDADRATFVIVRPTKKSKSTYERGNLEFAANGNAVDERDKLPIDRAEAARPLQVPPHVAAGRLVRSFVLDNGMKVILVPRETLIPTVTVAVEFRAGSALEPPDRAGLARIAASHIQAAGADWTMYIGTMERVGVAWGSTADEDGTRFYARGLELYLHEAIYGLERIIKTGDYSQAGIEEAQRLARVGNRRKSAAARERFEIAFQAALFPNHPYGHVETPTTLGRIGRDQAVAWKNDHYTAKNGTIVVVGRFDPGKAEASIRQTFGLWSGGHQDGAKTATSLERPGPTFLAVDGRELPTVELLIGYPLPAGNAGRAARMVLAEMMNERVASVREKLGASYGVYARQRLRVGPGELVIFGPVDAERAGEALVAIRAGVQALRGGDQFVEDFVRARRTVLSRLVAGASSSIELADRILAANRHGLPPEADEQLIQQVAALSPRDAMAALRDVRPEAEVVALLGARKFVEKAYQDAGITGVSWK